MALPVTISNVALTSKNSYFGPFKSSNEDIYIVVVDSSDGALIEVHKATDPTSSFTEQDSGNKPDLVNIVFSLWAFQDGDDLHITHQTFTPDVGYSAFHMATDLWDGTLNDLTVEGSFGDEGTARACSIAVRSDGDVIVLYNGAADKIHGTNYNRIDYGRKENGTFATVGGTC